MPNIMLEQARIYSTDWNNRITVLWCSSPSGVITLPIGAIDRISKTFAPAGLKKSVEALKNEGASIEESAINALGLAIHAVNHYSELEFFNE